ncbi:MAG: tetratricopeptide repeat protein [Bdellovibrionales bacterium]|nr:tetratricopeptide repeat protein [Bdellovibrionales bacterium]
MTRALLLWLSFVASLPATAVPGDECAHWLSPASQLRREIQDARHTGDSIAEEHAILALTAIEPANFRNWTSLGHFYFKQNKFEDSLKCFGRALVMEGPTARGLVDYAKSLRALGQLGDALRYLLQSLEKDPRDLVTLTMTAQLLIGFDQPKLALEYIEQVLTLAPDDKMAKLMRQNLINTIERQQKIY